MSIDISIRPVRTRSDERAFIKLPWSIYKEYPNWVPPLLMDRKKLIDRKGNPFYKHARMEMFLAERGGELIGRIAAIVNDNHIKEHKENIGFFGFFECINNQSVANALFDAAKAWLRTQGVVAMRGPASPSVNDEYGLLVDGFDRRPCILMSYNPLYYGNLIEGYGLKKIKDLYAYYVERDTVLTQRLERISNLVKKRDGFTFRSLDMKNFDHEVKVIHNLYTRAWQVNWGEVPLTEDEFNYMAKDLKPVVDPHLVIIAELNGKPIGFGMSLPDLNEILLYNKRGWLLPALLRMILFKKRIHGIRIIILGVAPEYLATGAGGVLFYETAVRAIGRGYPYGEASWVLEDNVMMNRGAELLNGRKTKTYRLYQMDI
jgi:GNAT superfamily N-acetyltransferase